MYDLDPHNPKQEVVRAKLLQSCLTLCDRMDCSPPGSSVYGILQTRILEWVTISFSIRYLLFLCVCMWKFKGDDLVYGLGHGF